jgi:hypothetical protein
MKTIEIVFLSIASFAIPFAIFAIIGFVLESRGILPSLGVSCRRGGRLLQDFFTLLICYIIITVFAIVVVGACVLLRPIGWMLEYDVWKMKQNPE